MFMHSSFMLDEIVTTAKNLAGMGSYETKIAQDTPVSTTMSSNNVKQESAADEGCTGQDAGGPSLHEQGQSEQDHSREESLSLNDQFRDVKGEVEEVIHDAELSLNNGPLVKSTVLASKVKEDMALTEVEEVETVARTDRHIHEVQILEQPVFEKVVKEDKHRSVIRPVEHKGERRTNDADTSREFARGIEAYSNEVNVEESHDTVEAGSTEFSRDIKHRHTIIQPIVYRRTEEKTIVHATQPVLTTIHEAPRLLPPDTLAPMTLEEYMQMIKKMPEVEASDIAHEVMRVKINE